MNREGGFPRTAACLRDNADEILGEWEREVRTRRGLAPDEGSSAVLRDDVPEMVQAIAAGLEAPTADIGEIPDRSPYEHALQRFEEDVPLEVLVAEYRLLRRALFRVVAARAPEDLSEVWPHIEAHLDFAIEEAVRRYSAQRTRWLREREQELETLLEELPVGVVVAEATTGRILRTNRELARILPGIGEAGTFEEAVALGVERIDGAPYSVAELPLSRAMRGEEAGPEELRVKTAAAASLVEVRARPLYGGEGDVRAAVAIVADVSERVRARTERQLLAATLGHDVRSPLSTIRIAGQRLQQVQDSAQVSKLSGGIVRSAVRLTDLVTELLELAKSWERPVDRAREPVDLAELCRHLVADQGMEKEGIEVRIDAPQAVVGRWDRLRITRIVENLLQNARKHGDPSAGIDIGIALRDEWAELSVVNRGEPIPPELASRLFEPYQRGEGGRGAGAGLGLYIVSEFTQAHGGRVEVESDASRTLFRVLLPIAGDASI